MATLLGIAALGMLLAGTAWLLRHATQPPAGTLGHALAHGLPTEPGEAGFDFTRDTYADGLQLWRVPGADPDGPTIVCLHDWGASPITLLPELEGHEARGSVILLPWLRGHGPNAGRCSLGPRELRDVADLIDGIAGPIELHGIGLGGWIAMQLANDACVHVHAAWRDRRDGLAHILESAGLPAFPLAWTGRICLP